MRQLPLPIHDEPVPTLDSYRPGANAAALALLMELLQQRADGAVPPPAYLWGPPGSGKSHLLQALAAAVREEGGGVLHVDAVGALPGGPEGTELLLLDDCEAYAAERQQAAFALFVDAVARGAWVVAAGRLPPVDLPLRDDLRTRLGWGHVIALQSVDEAAAGEVLAAEAARRGVRLPAELATYLMARFPRDLKTQSTLLQRLEAYALEHQRPLTLPTLRQMLQDDPLR